MESEDKAMSTPIEKIRRFTQEAPVNIEAMINSFGIELVRKATLHEKIAGQIEKNGDKYIISANKNDNYFRRRFTMAHELAHYLLHRGLIGEGIDDTKAYRSLDVGKFYNTSIKEEHEREANRLAAQLLMPEKIIRQYVSTNSGDSSDLAAMLQVSREALEYQLMSLGIDPKEMQKRVRSR
jgi:Zn-dependent peptidase ImmA (M78 family)